MMASGWSPILAALSALSILLGNFVALAQTNVRRLLAYSAVAHAGYTLMGLVAGGREGFSATLFYTTIYAITLIGAFAVVGVVKRETGGDDFENFTGLAARSPLAAACMAIFMLSLAGLPPLAGFFGKFYLFSATFRAGGNHGLLWLVVLALFGSFVSLYYYLSVLKVIYVDKVSLSETRHSPAAPEQSEAGSPVTGLPALALAKEGHFVALATTVVLAAAVFLIGVLPQVLAAVIAKAVP
jgi:NADH-quinone oxidoreductase subunit N